MASLGKIRFQMIRRGELPALQVWGIRLVAILLAMVTGGFIILALGHNPLAVYATMFRGALGTPNAIRETVRITTPLLGAAVAIAVAFKMRFWNIGAEGQILAGAIAASYFALFQWQAMPPWLLLVVMGVAGALAGGLVGLIPAVFKAKWGTNETLFTLMLNYIVLGVERYLQYGPWKNPATTFPKIAMFRQEAWLPKVFGVHIGWIIVLVFVVGMFFYLKYCKGGYEIAVVGESEATARYAGMNVGKIILRTMFISGAIAGLVGFIIVSGADHSLTETTTGGIGFTGISVAWLAGLNPLVMVVIATFLAVLQKGSGSIQTEFKIPASAAEVLTGLILFFMLGCEFFIRYQVKVRRGEEHHG